MTFPAMKHGTGSVLGHYEFGPYIGTLVHKPESAGRIKYLFQLVLTKRNSSKPVLVVTCESNEMQSALIEAISDQLDEETRREIAGASPMFLCYFDENGTHHNVTQLAAPPDSDSFRKRAFALAGEELGVSGDPVAVSVTAASVRSGSAAGKGQWVIWLAAIPLALVIAFPPYSQYFASSVGGVISGHGGWKFIFDIGQYNSRQSTESINITLWVVEILFVFVGGALLFYFVRRK